MPKIITVDAVTDPVHPVSEASNGSVPVKVTAPTSGKTVPRHE